MAKPDPRQKERELLSRIGVALPIPDADSPRGTIIAVPSSGYTLFRLVATNPPTAADFRPMSVNRADSRKAPEILRLGLSMYLTHEGASAVTKRPTSFIATVEVPASDRIHIAKTSGGHPAHVTVWAPIDLVLPNAEVSRAVPTP